MITNFEEYTYDITVEERQIAEAVMFGLGVGKSKAVKSSVLEARHKITGVRLRKIIGWLRRNGHLIIATSKGYYLTKNKNEIKDFVKSMRERAKSILEVADAIERAAWSNK